VIDGLLNNFGHGHGDSQKKPAISLLRHERGELQAAINRFVAETNHDPKPFKWTADPPLSDEGTKC
jgi:hypothetical protein